MSGGELPVVAIVGRPNVGKSTLFNALTHSRDALVADEPGMTRDRIYGRCEVGGRAVILIDTGGLTDGAEGIGQLITLQALQAVSEAYLVLFVVDARTGLCGDDEAIAQELRRVGKLVLLLANKVDGVDPDVAVGDFHSLGLGPPIPIAAAHGRGIRSLTESIQKLLPLSPGDQPLAEGKAATPVAVLGRPNVGKSTLINRILGEERMLTYDEPGTTRDSVLVPLRRDGKDYLLIDTAGVRRRPRVSQVLEKFSVVKTLQAIESSHVVVCILDAREGLAEQDIRLIGHVLRGGRALVVAVNKWDGLSPDQRRSVRAQIERRLDFVAFAPLHFISALHGTGVGELFPSIDAVAEAGSREMPTAELTRILLDAVTAHPPPLVRGRRIKLRYAHQGGQRPPTIVIHGNQTQALGQGYRRYLINVFRRAMNLKGTPIRLEFRTSKNPFEGRPNPLTPRQVKRRRRLMKHAKGR